MSGAAKRPADPDGAKPLKNGGFFQKNCDFLEKNVVGLPVLK